MWTPATRRRHDREHLRYASDLTDAEWALLEPRLPPPKRTRRRRATRLATPLCPATGRLSGLSRTEGDAFRQ